MIGVVVMAYGTPASPDEVEAYYTHIRRGRPPTDEQLADLRSRYEAIGGISPLRAISESQVARIRAALGEGYEVALGMKHAAPFIEDAVASLGDVERIVGVVLAPHFSRGSVGEYLDRLRGAAAVPVTGIETWADLDEWLDFQAAAVRGALAPDTTVVFTAHSLPERVLEGDRYPDELAASAAAIAARAGVSEWRVAWQSAGRTPEPWRGPDILEVLRDVDAPGVLVCAQGFTADHLEVLYDLDVQATSLAEDLGIAFARTRMVNDDVTVLAALADRIRSCA
ncbi:MAG: protoporphyrin/coproporphyrin ferrochelatase [Acidimicrobiaceae bacterium]